MPGRFEKHRWCTEHGRPRVECLEYEHSTKRDNPDVLNVEGEVKFPPRAELDALEEKDMKKRGRPPAPKPPAPEPKPPQPEPPKPFGAKGKK